MLPNKLNVTCLVSIGMHPLSRRARRAEQDARAVELGLNLAENSQHQLSVVHAGELTAEAEFALSSYLGMGLDELKVLSIPSQLDITTALTDYVRSIKSNLVIMGQQTEQGDSSAMLPYLLAQALSIPVVRDITEIIDVDNTRQQITLLQALPRGQRRQITGSLPMIICVDMAAKAPRQSAVGKALTGKITPVSVNLTGLAPVAVKPMLTATVRPKRLKLIKAKTAAERFKAATAKATNSGGKLVYDPQQGAQAIYDLLKQEKLL